MKRFTQNKIAILRKMMPYIAINAAPSDFIQEMLKDPDIKVSRATLYNYYNDRNEWLPQLLNIKDIHVEEKISEMLNQAREARKLLFITYKDADSSFAEVMALRAIIDSSYKEMTILQSLGLLPVKPVEIMETEEVRMIIENQFKDKDSVVNADISIV